MFIKKVASKEDVPSVKMASKEDVPSIKQA